MKTIFEYKQKVFPKVFLLLIFGFLPLIINTQLYLSFLYYLIFILAQVIIHIFYLSKRLIITDNGIEEEIFWGVSFCTTSWEDMEEAREIVSGGESPNSSLQSMVEPFAVIKWFVEKSMENTIKIIITNEEPLYINLREIKNSSDLDKQLRERIRFVNN